MFDKKNRIANVLEDFWASYGYKVTATQYNVIP